MALAVYPVCAIAAVTFFRVLSATFSGILIARLTVAMETPASLATSSMVADLVGWFSNYFLCFLLPPVRGGCRESLQRWTNIVDIDDHDKVFNFE